MTNTGVLTGDDVVQLYVAARGSKVERAARELKAFVRVSVNPSETKSVTLTVPVADLAYYDAACAWIVEPIEYDVLIGRHAEDLTPIRGRIEVVEVLKGTR